MSNGHCTCSVIVSNRWNFSISPKKPLLFCAAIATFRTATTNLKNILTVTTCNRQQVLILRPAGRRGITTGKIRLCARRRLLPSWDSKACFSCNRKSKNWCKSWRRPNETTTPASTEAPDICAVRREEVGRELLPGSTWFSCSSTTSSFFSTPESTRREKIRVYYSQVTLFSVDGKILALRTHNRFCSFDGIDTFYVL